MTSDQRVAIVTGGSSGIGRQPLSLLEEKKGPRLWWQLLVAKGRGGNSATSQRHWK